MYQLKPVYLEASLNWPEADFVDEYTTIGLK